MTNILISLIVFIYSIIVILCLTSVLWRHTFLKFRNYSSREALGDVNRKYNVAMETVSLIISKLNFNIRTLVMQHTDAALRVTQ